MQCQILLIIHNWIQGNLDGESSNLSEVIWGFSPGTPVIINHCCNYVIFLFQMDFYLLGVITNMANLVLVIPVLFITFLNMCHLWLVCHLLRFVRAAIIAFLCLSLGLSLAGEETSKRSVCSGLQSFPFQMKQKAKSLLQVEIIWTRSTHLSAKWANLIARLSLVTRDWDLNRRQKSLVTGWKGKGWGCVCG